MVNGADCCTPHTRKRLSSCSCVGCTFPTESPSRRERCRTVSGGMYRCDGEDQLGVSQEMLGNKMWGEM